MANFLFELLTEDMPHGVLPNTSQYIKDTLPSLLQKNGLDFDNITFYTTPRRLAFHITNLPQKGKEQIIEQKGPSVKAAYDEQGNPTKALTGFLSSYNVKLEDLTQIEIKGQPYLLIKKIEEGQALNTILTQIIQELIQGIKFAQPMRWNHKDNIYEFIRPVRGITALVDKEILPISLFGIDSNNILYGHRQTHPTPVTLSNADEYESTLKSINCIPSFEERTQKIAEEIQKIAKSINGHAILDQELLDILASLTENPHPILAEFEQKFLELPKEVLISEMKIHQKYVPIADSKGHLLPYYIITSNMPVSDTETKNNIINGNDRVLKARFADGQFFFDEDIKKGLQHYANQLTSVSFVEGAGSIADKIERMQNIATTLSESLAPNINTDLLSEAISLCKADLSSLMVGEFPELQGIIGSYYAKQEELDNSVALAIKEHYYPMNLNGESLSPSQELSALVGLADRIDNLFTLYAVGKTVSGSRDPYALRRQTIAIIQILRQFEWDQFSLEYIFSQISSLYTPFMQIPQTEWKTLIVDFIKTRLIGILKSENYQMEVLNASLDKIDVICLDIEGVIALQSIQEKHPEPFNRLVELYKRISNIIKDQNIQHIQESILVEPAEKKLFQHYQDIKLQLVQLSNYDALLELVKMESLISDFFDKIMVKTNDEKEANRISLLYHIQQLFKQYADFSKLSS